MTLYRTLTLIATTNNGTDAIGQPIVTETTRDVLVEVSSVTSTEFFAGQQNGLSPAYRFRIDRFGYKGESLCIYNGTRYAIYKSFESDNNYIDLYAEEVRGVTNV